MVQCMPCCSTGLALALGETHAKGNLTKPQQLLCMQGLCRHEWLAWLPKWPFEHFQDKDAHEASICWALVLGYVNRTVMLVLA